jgi:pyridoxamine 5'-phosphate oxidase
MSITNLRKDYTLDGLSEADLAGDPFSQFGIWLAEALEAQLPEPNAMTLATADGAGRPSARIVLLRGFDAAGFVWYTNYESRKGRELSDNPYAALVFYWPQLERQVRIEGPVAVLEPSQSDAYFSSRPRGSRLGAWASPQSQVIAERALLDARLAEVAQRFPAEELPRPPFWGGFRLAPEVVEFWQGRPSRLHDRLRYRKEGEIWLVERLAP